MVDNVRLTKLRRFGWGVASAWLTLFARPGPLSAAETSSAAKASSIDVERAASFFEQGVEHFVAERFEAAARSFLEADRVVQSADALGNALSAARRARVDLLILRVAREVLVRGDTTGPLRFAAREAIAEIAPRVAQAIVQCARPCTLREGNSARALRPDVLVGASVGAALLTTAWGVFGVEWKPVQQTRVSISDQHLGFVTAGEF